MAHPFHRHRLSHVSRSRRRAEGQQTRRGGPPEGYGGSHHRRWGRCACGALCGLGCASTGDQVQAHELEDEDESMVVKVEPGVDGVRQGFAVNGNGGVGNGNGLPEDEEAEEDEGELETAGTTPAAEKASGVMVMGESGRVDATSSLVLQLTPRKSQGFRSRWTTSPRRIRSS
jgi:hypothetical protein